MPIYEYSCSSCRHTFEKVQKITAPGSARCPKCGKAARRQISQTSFVLKGTGWYKTDYASGGSSTQKKKEGETAGAGKTSETGGGGGKEGSSASATKPA
ncbi:MAG: zinc ribbon domain-containing protein [Nitrospirae bacterium]|nr:zinc ribbon domain-containing protein [Nitrospirota bacterium]